MPVVFSGAALAVAVVAVAVAVWARRDLTRTRRELQELEGRVEEQERRPAEAALAPAADDSPAVTVVDAVGDADLLTDSATGLFSESYFRVALEARISAARRHLRPVAVVLLEVVDGLNTGLPRPAKPEAVAAGVRETVRDADTACRMEDGRYGLVLEDTPENGAIWTVERIRRRLSEHAPGQTLWAGVACYPAHAFDTDEILQQAEAALEAAREWRQDRIEVATTP